MNIPSHKSYERVQSADQSGCGQSSDHAISPNLLALSSKCIAVVIDTAKQQIYRIETVRNGILVGAIVASVLFEQRGGSQKIIKQNLIHQNKANSTPPMPDEQKRLRKRKRRK